MLPGIGRIGFWAGMVACSATVAYVVVQLLQVAGLLHFPFDEILIYGTSLGIVVPFVLEILALHYSSPVEKRFWSHAALLFATMYAVFGSANYVVQLGTVIPAKLRGAGDTVRLLEQTPHSLLWDFDALAYFAMGLATLVMVPALAQTRLERWLRAAALAHVVATVLSGVVYFYPTFSNRLLLIGFPWGITAPVTMLLLALVLRARVSQRSGTNGPPSGPP